MAPGKLKVQGQLLELATPFSNQTALVLAEAFRRGAAKPQHMTAYDQGRQWQDVLACSSWLR